MAKHFYKITKRQLYFWRWFIN